MLHSLISVKLVAMAAALGLNTSEWKNPSPDMVAQVEKLEKALADIADTQKAEAVQTELNAAYTAIRELAEKGDKDAQYAMGLLSRQSNQEGAVEQSVRYFELAAKQGQLQAMNNYGTLLATSSRDQATQTEGVDMIKKAAEAGENSARRNMAQVLLRGMGGEKIDPAAAKKLLETAAAEKDADAAFDLSQFYGGQGGKESLDGEKAWEWLNKSAELGSASGLDTLGTLLFQGGKIGAKEIPADAKAAVAKFQSLAEKNNPVGLRKMAGVYQDGLGGVTKDFQKAVENYTKAAQGNDSLAQFVLANMFNNGVDLDPKDEKIDLPANAATALNLYRAAAQNNLPIASFNVGMFYEQGRTVDRDMTKAFTSFQQAAQAGVPLAMQKVGLYYLNGAGTLKDPIAAAGWFSRAAQAGLPEGHLNYAKLTEAGVNMAGDKATPFYTAADSYMQAADAPNAADGVRQEALLRLGNLYFRGVMVAKGEEPKPDYERAYIFFSQAADVDPKNEVAKGALAEVAGKLTQDQIKKANASIESMKKDREARRAKAEAAASPAP
ncbi:sel1 repeat family protein [Phragmitibacter flavus]|uniref:Sel1 repeat family protein n=1 Tax=Phragmitibacter flavus TaxID=2576071 RepID=A0A5R8KC22_9BACT|nr:tetratricopeptide repeat protein [Phragmitibacter flavus]TLD69841.1 sel1 repeat family protein [Phragmitibacter flavus]